MKRMHLAPRLQHQNQQTNAHEHPAIRVIPAKRGSRANHAIAAVTAANLATAERVARAVQPTIVVEPRPPVVLNQLAEIPKPCARVPTVVATAMVEVVATAGRKGLQESPAHLAKSDHPAAEVPMQKAVQWISLGWSPQPPFRVASCREFPQALS